MMPPEKYKVLFINYTSYIGGGETFLLEMIEKLDKNRFEPWVVCPPGGPLSSKLHENSVKYYNIDFARINKKVNIIKYFRNLLELVFFVNKNKFDLICCNAPATGFLGVAAGKLFGIPVIVYMLTLSLTRIQALVLKAADLIITISSASLKALKRCGISEEKIKIIRPIYDTERFEHAPVSDLRKEINVAESDFLIGMIARIDPLKGQHLLIEAANNLKGINNLKWVIIGGVSESCDIPGSEEYLVKLKNKIKEHSLENKVILAGFLSEDISSLLKSLDLVVLPSYTELLPISIIEAMAAGVPVIASDVGGISDEIISGKTGLLIPADDAGALTGAVNELYCNRERLRILAVEAQNRVRDEFGYKKNLSLMQDTFEQLIMRKMKIK